MIKLDRVRVVLPMHGKCPNRLESFVLTGVEFGAEDMTVTGGYNQCSECWRTMWVDSFDITREG